MRSAVASTASVWLVLAGCTLILDPDECTGKDDCESGLVCRDGVCFGTPKPEPDDAAVPDDGPITGADVGDERDVGAEDADLTSDMSVDEELVPDAMPPDAMPPDVMPPDAAPDALVNDAPTCAFIRPAVLDRPVNVQVIAVEVLVDDDHTPLDELEVSINGAVIELDEDGRYVDEEFALPFGARRTAITLVVRDEHLELCSARVDVEVDLERPVFLGLPMPPAFATNESPFRLTGRVIDEWSGVDSLTADLSDGLGANPVPFDAEDGEFEIELQLENGEHLVVLTAIDRAGNDTSILVEIDFNDASPAVLIAEPDDGEAFGLARIHVDGAVNDDGDLESISVDLVVRGLAGAGPRTVRLGRANALGRFESDIDLYEGANEICALATDAFGNIGSACVEVILDTRPPQISVDTPDDGGIVERELDVCGTMSRNTRSVEIAFRRQDGAAEPPPYSEAIEAELDVDAGTWCGQVELPGDGRYEIRIVAQSVAEPTAEVVVEVIVDTSPPIVTITEPEEGACISDRNVQVRGTIEENESRIFLLRVNGVPTAPLGGTFVVEIELEDGSNQPIVVEADNLARLQGSATVNVTVDLTAPTLEVITPVDGGFVTTEPESGLIALRGRFADGGCGLDTLMLGEQVIPFPEGTFDFGLDLDEGPNELTLVGRDRANNEQTVTMEFTVDNSDPVIANVEPDGFFATRADTVIVGADVSDAVSGLTEVRIGGLVVEPDEDGRVSRLVAIEEGENVIPIAAIDNVGRETRVDVVLNRDLDDPVVLVDFPTGGQPVEVITDVLGRIEDGEDGSGVEIVRVNGRDAVIDPMSGTWSLSGLVLFAGGNDITVVAIDRAGNESESVELGVFVRNFSLVDRVRAGLEGASETGWIGIADLDGDRRLDLVGLPREADGVPGVFLQVDNNVFTRVALEEAAIPSEVAYRAAAIGDFNNDGLFDIAYGGPGDNGVLRGFGGGVFGDVIGHGLAVVNTTDLVAGDTNRDGNLDLIQLGGAGSVILIGDGSGTFSRQELAGAGIADIVDMTRAAFIDVTGDNILDVAAVGPGGARLWQGSPTPGRYVITDPDVNGFPNLPASSVAIVDADRDGDLDVLRVNPEPDFALNNGTGAAWNPNAFGLVDAELTGVVGAAVGDIDGNARDDVVFYGAGGLSVWQGGELGYRSVGNEDLGVPDLTDVGVVQLIDIDDDGDLDMLVGTPQGIDLIRSNATVTEPNASESVKLTLRRGNSGFPGPADSVGLIVRQDLGVPPQYNRAVVAPPAAPVRLSAGAVPEFTVRVEYTDIGAVGGNNINLFNMRPGDEEALDAPNQ